MPITRPSVEDWGGGRRKKMNIHPFLSLYIYRNPNTSATSPLISKVLTTFFASMSVKSKSKISFVKMKK